MHPRTGFRLFPKASLLLFKLQSGVWLRAWGEVFQAPMHPVLHASPWRLRLLGIGLALGQPLFGWVWGVWLVQPYENLWLRMLLGLLGLVLLLKSIASDPTSALTQRVTVALCWIELPFFFCWMFLCNGESPVWLASLCAIILVFYHLTDWRIATVGTFTGALAAWIAFAAVGPEAPAIGPETTKVSLMVIGFSWFCAFLLGLSSANLRREQLKQTLTTMGIMAHELRTPLATVSLVGDALRSQAHVQPLAQPDATPQLAKLAARLHTLVRQMNHQIDTQITNARLLKLPSQTDTLTASQLLQEVVHNHPYRSPRERQCIELVLRRDFRFLASQPLFAQVIDNLIKNALHSLAARSEAPKPGDLRIEAGSLNGRGRIVVTDKGKGIDPALQPRIFEPFFSTEHRTGHGLGLAFCRRVVLAMGGGIRVESEVGRGAVFTIDLPLVS